MHFLGVVMRGLWCRARRNSDVISNPRGDNPLIGYLENHPEGRLLHRVRHYFDIYHRHFSRFRGQPVTMIEIGVARPNAQGQAMISTATALMTA